MFKIDKVVIGKLYRVKAGRLSCWEPVNNSTYQLPDNPIFLGKNDAIIALQKKQMRHYAAVAFGYKLKSCVLFLLLKNLNVVVLTSEDEHLISLC
jgi:hypothetical protein